VSTTQEDLEKAARNSYICGFTTAFQSSHIELEQLLNTAARVKGICENLVFKLYKNISK
jgi:hypothetical protein